MRHFLLMIGIFFLLSVPCFAIPQNGLIAYYPLDGNANDSSGNLLNGIVHGAVPVADRFGNPSGAYSFDGIDDYIDLGNSSFFNIPHAITISAWVKPMSLTGWGFIVSKAQACRSAANYNMMLVDNGLVFDYWEGSVSASGIYGDKLYQASPALNTGQWYHLAVTYNFSTFEINTYMNGVHTGGTWLNDFPPQVASPILTQNRLSLGAALIYSTVGNCATMSAGDPIGAFDGVIDEVALYNRILSESEIHELASSCCGLFTITPSDHDYGICAVGGTTSQTFTVRNVTFDEVEISDIHIIGADQSEFTLANDHCSGVPIAPFEAGTFDVIFSPGSLGSKSSLASISLVYPEIHSYELYLSALVTQNCEGDLNHDGRMDMRDWLIFGQDWGRRDCLNNPDACECDLNHDGRCDMRDWLKFGEDWGRRNCPVQ